MGFVLLLIFIVLFIGAVAFIASDKENWATNCSLCMLISAIICSLLLAVIWGVSWSTYSGLQKRAAIIEQYQHTINVYADKGVAEFRANSGTSSEFTDLKYQNYQVKLARMIVDLRSQIVKYNNTLVGKRVSKVNWFWNWCIIAAPEDFKVLKMADYID